MDGSGWYCSPYVNLQTVNIAPNPRPLRDACATCPACSSLANCLADSAPPGEGGFNLIDPAQPGVLNYVVKFDCATLNSFPLLTPSLWTNDPAPASATIEATANRTVLASIPMSGTFRLTYDGVLTRPLNWNAGASDVQAALQAITGLNTVDVWGPTPPTGNVYDGTVFYITLWSPAGPAPPITVVTTAPVPGSSNMTYQTLLGDGIYTAVTVLQNGSTDALLWPIPMDYFRYASPGAWVR